MSDLISRKAVVKLLHEEMQSKLDFSIHDALINVEFGVDELPSVEPPKGEWIDVEEFYFDYKCSLCGGLSEFDTPFCQHCGVVMRKKV